MWLIDTTDLVLKYVSTEQSRKTNFAYAILSHTWGDDEVLFDDMRLGRGRTKQGWYKVLQTCEQARRDGLWWAWVDSCCINKESSAELSEAINSMWQWYCGATVCYAFLPDVDANCIQLCDADNPYLDEDRPDDLMETRKLSAHWYDSFGTSRWFTRGWTLQELIAPKLLKFYGAGWRPIGSKESLIRTIYAITKIDPRVLKSRNVLHQYVAARKMSWAANRSTTRVEDRAYSLLGLFGVNLPLLYGEGDQAFVRLQEEIIRTSTDQSIFAWDGLKPADREHASKRFPKDGNYLKIRQNFYLGSTHLGTGSIVPDDMIFARSPDQFSSGHCIVSWQNGYANKPFRLNNQGVHFEGASFVQRDAELVMLLNCRYEDDFTGGICLRVCQHDEFIPDGLEDNSNDFWVPPDWVVPPFKSRVAVSTASGSTTVMSRYITLLRRHPNYQNVLRVAKEILYNQAAEVSLPSIWVVSGQASIDTVVVVDGYPRDLWNLDTGVMCPIENWRPLSRIGHIGFTVSCQNSKEKFPFFFEVPDDPLELKMAFEQEKGDLEMKAPGTHVDCFARIQPIVEIMGSRVAKIEVTIRRKTLEGAQADETIQVIDASQQVVDTALPLRTKLFRKVIAALKPNDNVVDI